MYILIQVLLPCSSEYLCQFHGSIHLCSTLCSFTCGNAPKGWMGANGYFPCRNLVSFSRSSLSQAILDGVNSLWTSLVSYESFVTFCIAALISAHAGILRSQVNLWFSSISHPGWGPLVISHYAWALAQWKGLLTTLPETYHCIWWHESHSWICHRLLDAPVVASPSFANKYGDFMHRNYALMQPNMTTWQQHSRVQWPIACSLSQEKLIKNVNHFHRPILNP